MGTPEGYGFPPDVWWLLRVPVKAGEPTPYHLFIAWYWQFFVKRREVLPS